VQRRILVTGGAGYIGDSVVKYIQQWSPDKEFKVDVLDDLVYGGTYMRDVKFIRADITDTDEMSRVLTRNGGYDAVIHLAALVGDGACSVNPQRTTQVNLEATKTLALLSKATGARFIFASTCSVYGDNNELLDEESKTNPLSIYARTKLAAEDFIKENLTDYVIFRLGTLFGMSTEYARVRCDLVANILTYRAAQGETLQVFGGEQWRPLLHVRDAAKGFAQAALMLGQQAKFSPGTFILAEKNYRISDLAEEIVDIVGRGKIESTPAAFEDLRNYKVDDNKSRAVGYCAGISVRNGVTEMLKILSEGRISDVWSPEFHNAKYIRAKYGH
jgi:nucleoside-diphosphate-sugar epimerase